MREQVLGLVLCSGLLLSGPATAAVRSTPVTTREPVRESDDGERVKAGECANWRWIGVMRSGAAKCPAAPGWKERRLFDPPKGIRSDRQPEAYAARERSPRVSEDARAALAELDRFCVYESDAKQPPATPFASPQSAGMVRLDRDCAAISRSADLSDGDWTDVAEHFLAEAGQPTEMNVTKQRGVRLAFLDTQPTEESVPHVPGNSKHGYTLAHIARHLVCSPDNACAAKDATCAALITTQLAMPIRFFDARSRQLTRIDLVHGGSIGTQSDLANAIYREVDAWMASVGQPDAPQHLVLNLSLGWDPKQIGEIDATRASEVEAGTQAVYRALNLASSLDVLVLAAAGNKRNCCPETDEQQGQLLPAAWEETSRKVTARAQAPLIYSVGGVRSDGTPLRNARPHGMPLRVAIGENGIVSAWEPFRPTWLYSGSSIATAVVSSTAAVVWDSFPDLTSHQVMDILDKSGSAVSFGSSYEHPKSHRISLCTAVKAACADQGSTACPVRGECRPLSNERTSFPPWAYQPPSRACHPWVTPQPSDPPCPPCEDKP